MPKRTKDNMKARPNPAHLLPCRVRSGVARARMAHHDDIVDQFTRQADVFANAPAITDDLALDLLVRAVGTTREDTVP